MTDPLARSSHARPPRAGAPWAVVCFLALALAASCDAPPAYDRAALLRDTVDEVIVPGYDALDDAAAVLDQSAGTLCAAPDRASLEAARAAWLEAALALARTSAYQIGPAREMNLASEIGFWPSSPTAIERNVAATEPIDAGYVDALGAGSKGLPALSYLLFGGTPDATAPLRTDDEVVLALTTSPRRCEYVVALAAHVARTAHALSLAWRPEGGGYGEVLASAGDPDNVDYPDRETALVALITQLLETLKLAKNTKLGIPIGHRTGLPSPLAVQSPYASASVALMDADLRGARALWTEPTHSFDAMLAARDPALAERTRGGLDASVAGLVALGAVAETDTSTFPSYAAGPDRTVGETAYTRMDDLEATLATEVAGRLGLSVAFSDMDGD